MRSQLSFIRRVVSSLYVLLLLGHSVSLAAKYDLKGTVIGADGKVKVELAGTKKDARTKKDGAFKLSNVPEGEYTLQVFQDKKVIHEQSINVTEDDDNLEVKIGASSIALAEKTVSSLALRCVMTKVSCLPKPNIIVFDEIFGKVANTNLDLIGNFFQKCSEMFPNIFLITHNEIVKDWSTKILTINKKNNVSSLLIK